MKEIEDGELLRVGDLRECHVVVVECRNCDRQARVPQRELRQIMRTSMPLVDAAFKPRCPHCGTDGAQRVKLYELTRNEGLPFRRLIAARIAPR